jgi:hypothetical protein
MEKLRQKFVAGEGGAGPQVPIPALSEHLRDSRARGEGSLLQDLRGVGETFTYFICAQSGP